MISARISSWHICSVQASVSDVYAQCTHQFLTCMLMVYKINSTPTERQVSKRQVSNVRFQNVSETSGLQNFRFTKRQVYNQVYKMSCLQNVRLQNVRFQDVNTSKYYKMSAFKEICTLTYHVLLQPCLQAVADTEAKWWPCFILNFRSFFCYLLWLDDQQWLISCLPIFSLFVYICHF